VRGAAGSVGACAQLPFKYLGIELTGDNADPNAVMPRFTYEAAGGCTPSKSGSHLTLRWRERDSNPRFRERGTFPKEGLFEIAPSITPTIPFPRRI
jgi:hypothetical protein